MPPPHPGCVSLKLINEHGQDDNRSTHGAR
jgi:hypothetical protein